MCIRDRPNERVAYTRQRLQVISGVELPPTTILKKKQTTFIIYKIVGKKIVRDKVYYKIRWKGYKENDDTWEPPQHLNKKLIDDYEKTI